MRPKRSAACSTTCATSSWTVQSAGTARASEPTASISRTQASSASEVRAVTTTFAPRAPARRATARPRPLEAPVTRITCSLTGFLRAMVPACPESGYATHMPNIGPWEIILLLLLALLLFGAKRLPEIGRSLGSGMREFKDSVSGTTKPDHETERAELPPASPDATASTTSSRERENEVV